jgi:hypothetical protein
MCVIVIFVVVIGGGGGSSEAVSRLTIVACCWSWLLDPFQGEEALETDVNQWESAFDTTMTVMDTMIAVLDLGARSYCLGVGSIFHPAAVSSTLQQCFHAVEDIGWKCPSKNIVIPTMHREFAVAEQLALYCLVSFHCPLLRFVALMCERLATTPDCTGGFFDVAEELQVGICVGTD